MRLTVGLVIHFPNWRSLKCDISCRILQMMESSSGTRTRNLRKRKPDIIEDAEDIDDSRDSDVQEVAQVAAPRTRRARKLKFTPEKKQKTDEVRAPIPQMTDVLSEGDEFAVRARNEQFVDLRQQFKEQSVHSKRQAKASGIVFDSLRDYRGDEDAYLQQLAGMGSSGSAVSARGPPKSLADLYRVPFEIVTPGTFELVRQTAITKKLWLMVNIHNPTEFSCKRMVRDCLCNEAVKEIIKENFIFWNTDHVTKEGLRYIAHYQVVHYPHLSIIDPRTGEKVSTYGEMNALEFCNAISEFLADKPTYGVSTAARHVAVKPSQAVSRQLSDSSVQIIDPEEEELKKAMKLSEDEAAREKEKSSRTGMDDILEGFLTDDDEDEDEVETEEVRRELKKDSWKEFLGGSEDPEVAFKIRLPTGDSVDFAVPNSSQLQAVFKYIAFEGFSLAKFDVFTSFPRRSITSLEPETLLRDAGFAAREMLFVQEKETS